MNYDGFDGTGSTFPDMLTVTEKIEDYIIENHQGTVDGAYGSSLGGSFVGLLIQRKRIHINHGFIGSSDLDQTGKFVGKIQATIISNLLYRASKSERGKKRLINALKKGIHMEDTSGMEEMMSDLTMGISHLKKETVYNQFYSDLITPLEDQIDVNDTIVHVIYALKMGEKYEERYLKHFKNLDIHRLDMQHEAWMFDKEWEEPVLDVINECMEMHVKQQV
ncbi:2-Hydroxy-6-Oxo-6-Phenylhexa-2,4-Dienoate hydrolase [Lachnospiraceae bacterium TWA4]|nr:2-Hydroxy-6-Oxo-6-Phenylhexa-2,4-Dienoate hydrolase [Lachnospiraceae bacterium TWA4]